MRQLNLRLFATSAVGLGVSLLLAGCGAGQITQTNTQQAAVNGAYGQVGSLIVRDAAIVNRDSCEQAYPQGESAPLRLWVINHGAKDDQLLSVSSELAADAVIDGDKALVAGRTLAIGPATEPAASPQAGSTTSQATPSSSESSASSPSSSTSSPSASSSAPQSSSASPTSTAASSDLGTASVKLQGLKRAVWPGQTVKVTFVFRDAGPLTVDLPIAAPSKPLKCEVPTEGAPAGH